MRYLLLPALLLLGACTAQVSAPPADAYLAPPPSPVVSIYVDPPISQPPPIAVAWAPPPMLVESPPPPPDAVSVWVGGYWVWEGNWVWAHGRWVSPPRPEYTWVHPYYENRGGVVIFVNGHWAQPGAVFVPPPPGLHLALEVARPGVIPGARPSGPDGCFVPPPPGSRLGIIVPAPIGTPPAVVTSAPPVMAAGMRITANVTHSGNAVIINKNVTNVTIIAPASVTISGKAVSTAVPAQAHLAASLVPVVRAQAPLPQSSEAIPAYAAGQAPVRLPPPQIVSVAGQEPARESPGGGAKSQQHGSGMALPAMGHAPEAEAGTGRHQHPSSMEGSTLSHPQPGLQGSAQVQPSATMGAASSEPGSHQPAGTAVGSAHPAIGHAPPPGSSSAGKPLLPGGAAPTVAAASSASGSRQPAAGSAHPAMAHAPPSGSSSTGKSQLPLAAAAAAAATHRPQAGAAEPRAAAGATASGHADNASKPTGAEPSAKANGKEKPNAKPAEKQDKDKQH